MFTHLAFDTDSRVATGVQRAVPSLQRPAALPGTSVRLLAHGAWVIPNLRCAVLPIDPEAAIAACSFEAQGGDDPLTRGNRQDAVRHETSEDNDGRPGRCLDNLFGWMRRSAEDRKRQPHAATVDGE